LISPDIMSSNLQMKIKAMAKLSEDLDASIQLQSFCPDAFDMGAVNAKIIGSASRGYTFVVGRGDGSARIFELEDVPRLFMRRHLNNIPVPALRTLLRFSPYLQRLHDES